MYSIIQKLLLAFFITCVISTTADGSLFQDKKKQGMIQELEIFKHHFEVSYAPLDWKKEHINWDLDEAFKQAKQRILNADNITTKQFHQIVRDFAQSTQDYHVGAVFCSTENATLPFTARGIEGRYYIDWFDCLLLPQSYFDIRVGDELIEFDGQPIGQVMEELMVPARKQLNSLTEQSLAEISLTNRSGKKGDRVPNGTIMIKTRSSITGKDNVCQIRWIYTPEYVFHPMDLLECCILFPFTETSNNNAKKRLKIPYLQMINPLYQEEPFTLGGNQRGLGCRKSFLPKLGEIVWEIIPDKEKSGLLPKETSSDIETPPTPKTDSDEEPQSQFWNAYIYKNDEGHLIGYVRIPHYSMEEDLLKEFEKLMGWMNDQTKALVIDQLNNPGGYSNRLYHLASCLTNYPLATPKEQVKISQAEVLEALEFLEWIEDYEKMVISCSKRIEETIESEEISQLMARFEGINFQQLLHIKSYYEHIVNEWEAGRSLTNPIHLVSFDMVNPKPNAQYTKPIVMLINELDFSCGDFMPAILQDNKRAILFGTRTAGAGGAVKSFSIPSQHGIYYGALTLSIAERINKNKIENLGIKPDVEYQLTVEDISGGYKGYIEAVNQTLNILLKNAL